MFDDLNTARAWKARQNPQGTLYLVDTVNLSPRIHRTSLMLTHPELDGLFGLGTTGANAVAYWQGVDDAEMHELLVDSPLRIVKVLMI